MSVTGVGGMIAATVPGRLAPGTVLVADELVASGRPAVPCPAAPLVAGELRRRGLATAGGALSITGEPPAAPGAPALAALLPAGGGDAGLGVAADAGDPPAVAAARDALAAWLGAAGPRAVALASPRSFCAGVERAVEIVRHALDRRDGPVYVRKQIVHNTHVVADLEACGAVFVDELDAVPDGETVVFSAHGVSPAVRDDAARRGLDVIDATCPLVTKVHAEARRFAARGDTVILIGHAGHEEVEGTLGEAPAETVLVETAADVDGLRVRDPSRVSYLTQTTLAVDETDGVIAALRARFPHISGPRTSDICYATQNRQDAVKALAAASDVVLVVGSSNSSNSRRLVEVAERHGAVAHLIDDEASIEPRWLAHADTVGLTAGASAPEALVQRVLGALRAMGADEVVERPTTHETVRFKVPAPADRRET